MAWIWLVCHPTPLGGYPDTTLRQFTENKFRGSRIFLLPLFYQQYFTHLWRKKKNVSSTTVIARPAGPWQSPGKMFRYFCLYRWMVAGDCHVVLLLAMTHNRKITPHFFQILWIKIAAALYRAAVIVISSFPLLPDASSEQDWCIETENGHHTLLSLWSFREYHCQWWYWFSALMVSLSSHLRW